MTARKRPTKNEDDVRVASECIQSVFDTMGLATAYDRLRYASPVAQPAPTPFVVTISSSSTPYNG